MTNHSSAELLVLHAVRLLGFADTATVAHRGGVDFDESESLLLDAQAYGWVQHDAFFDLVGWSLTERGKAENQRQLAVERESADPQGVIAAVYREFLPLNARLLRAVTDWQLKPVEGGPSEPNDHCDKAWDEDVLSELAAIGAELGALNARLTGVLARFDGYAARYAAALLKARNGQSGWVDKSDIESCHKVWFQLHEDLVATLGIDRLTDR